MMPKITPFLWFDNNAEEAMTFYVSIFQNSSLYVIGDHFDEFQVGQVYAYNYARNTWTTKATFVADGLIRKVDMGGFDGTEGPGANDYTRRKVCRSGCEKRLSER